MKTDRTGPEAIAFKRAYQTLVDASPEAPEFLSQTIGDQEPRPSRTMGPLWALGIGLAAIVLTALGVALRMPSFELISEGGPTGVSSTVTEALPQPVPIEVVDLRCSSATALTNACVNLIDGTWVEARLDVSGLPPLMAPLTVEMTFAEPMVIEQILVTNPEAGDAFDRSFRVKGLTILAEGNEIPLAVEIEDRPGLQRIEFAALRAEWVRITVQTMWPPSSESSALDVLAIAEIEVLGFPAP